MAEAQQQASGSEQEKPAEAPMDTTTEAGGSMAMEANPTDGQLAGDASVEVGGEGARPREPQPEPAVNLSLPPVSQTPPTFTLTLPDGFLSGFQASFIASTRRHISPAGAPPSGVTAHSDRMEVDRTTSPVPVCTPADHKPGSFDGGGSLLSPEAFLRVNLRERQETATPGMLTCRLLCSCCSSCFGGSRRSCPGGPCGGNP